jgi:hypothetical protein
MAAAYEEFVSANSDFNIVVSDWTPKGGESNRHDDPDHDAAVWLAQPVVDSYHTVWFEAARGADPGC